MASLIYNSMPEDMAKGNIDFDSHDIYALLVTSDYSEDKSGHAKRSDVTNEVEGGGYPAGGVQVVVTVTKDSELDETRIELGQAIFDSVTLTARKAIYYRRRGGAASADELIACNDFGEDKIISGGQFIVEPGIITIDNP